MDLETTISNSDIVQPLNILVALHDDCDALMPFQHALCLANASKGTIEIVDMRSKQNSIELSVRKTFEKWGILPKDSPREAVEKLGIKVKRIVKPGNPLKEIINKLEKQTHDLLVFGTEERSGISYLFGRDITEQIIKKKRQTTLYIPNGSKPFINLETGELCLRTVLVPVATKPPPEESFSMLQKIRTFIPSKALKVVAVHAGDPFPFISASVLEGFSYRELTLPSTNEPIASAIIHTAVEEKADLIVMATIGRSSVKQKIMGSITEQVLRRAHCPVLAVAAA